LALWETDAQTYRIKFNSWNVCNNTYNSWPNQAANWWDPVREGKPDIERLKHVHIVNSGSLVPGGPNLPLGISLPNVSVAEAQKLIKEWSERFKLNVTIGETDLWFILKKYDRNLTMSNLSDLMQTAQNRGAATVWITEASPDPSKPQNLLYDQLPPFWDDEVSLCQ
jgi:hypothetical protein